MIKAILDFLYLFTVVMLAFISIWGLAMAWKFRDKNEQRDEDPEV